MRVARPVILEPDEHKALEARARARSGSARSMERARIVLLAHSGMQNRQIAARLGVTPEKVARWRNRFLDGGHARAGKGCAPAGKKAHNHRRKSPGCGADDDAGKAAQCDSLEHPDDGSGGGSQREGRAPDLARARFETASKRDVQSQLLSPVRGEAGGHRRSLSESAGARHRPVRGREKSRRWTALSRDCV